MTILPQQREKVPDDYSVVDPEHKLIYRFVRTLFSSAQLTAECAIVTLVWPECEIHLEEYGQLQTLKVVRSFPEQIFVCR